MHPGLLILAAALAAAVAAPSLAAAPQHDLPIATHWSNSLPGVVEGASDECPWGNPRRYHPADPLSRLFYNGRFLPDYELYGGDVFSIRSVDNQEALDFAANVQGTTGVEVVHLNQRAWAEGRVQPNSGKVQIIHNNQIAGSLATIFLPPNWRPTAAGNYPILFNGFYDTNANTFDWNGPFMAGIVAVSTQNGGRGAIGVLWNGGGALVSRTGNRRAYDQFNSVIDFVAEKGGSRFEIVIYGSSRGGGTALEMASNPYHQGEYRVAAVCASCFPAKYGENITLTSMTYPGLLSAVEWSVGVRDSWRTGWVYPPIPHPLAGLTANEAHLQVLVGETDPEMVDDYHSLTSESFLDGLENEKPVIYLQAGSHDYQAPYSLQMKYVHELEKRSITATVDVVIGIGHNTREMLYSRPSINVWASVAIAELILGRTPAFPPGVNFFRVDRNTCTTVEFTPDRFPFTVEFPYMAVHGQTLPVVAVGEPETEYRVNICDTSTGLSLLQVRGTIGEDRTDTQWIDDVTQLPAGTYVYRVEIKDGPGSQWREIPRDHTPLVYSEPLLEVMTFEPPLDGKRAQLWATSPVLRQLVVGINWGLCEY
jgi:hypothetical protein